MAARTKRGSTRDTSSSGKSRGKVYDRRKSCMFCKDKVEEIDYKNTGQLKRCVSHRGKIRSRGNTGTCRRHQRQVAVAVKRAREMALLPYVGDAPEPTRPRSRSYND